jgi:FixJ family two-component response regulator
VDRFTIFLIDDDIGTMTALSGFLRAAGYATKTYYSSQAFLSGHDASIPGCVILDLSLPGLNGLEVQQSLSDQGIDRPVIFISGKTAVPEIVRAMRAGAIDFLIKPVDEAQLLNAIKSAEEWDKTRRNIEARRKIVLQKIAKLTRREKEVLALMVAGLQTKAIGEKLRVGEKTVKVHRARVHQKSCRTGKDDARDDCRRSQIVDFLHEPSPAACSKGTKIPPNSDKRMEQPFTTN